MINQVLFHNLLISNHEILQKLLRYLTGIVTSAFKAHTGGCGGHGGRGGWDLSGFGVGCGGCSGLFGLSSVFHTIFVLYLNDLPSETLPS